MRVGLEDAGVVRAVVDDDVEEGETHVRAVPDPCLHGGGTRDRRDLGMGIVAAVQLAVDPHDCAAARQGDLHGLFEVAAQQLPTEERLVAA